MSHVNKPLDPAFLEQIKLINRLIFKPKYIDLEELVPFSLKEGKLLKPVCTIHESNQRVKVDRILLLFYKLSPSSFSS